MGAALLAQYLSGYLFLWSYHLNPLAASPLTVLRYAYHYGDRPAVRQRLFWVSVAGFGLVALAGGAVLKPRARPLHGDARFARRSEIARAGLLHYEGFLLGEYRRRYLMLAGQQGVALLAPPRSGKGVGFVIPNLLNWPGSVVVTDIKKENWTLTAGYRKESGQHVHLCTYKWLRP